MEDPGHARVGPVHLHVSMSGAIGLALRPFDLPMALAELRKSGREEGPCDVLAVLQVEAVQRALPLEEHEAEPVPFELAKERMGGCPVASIVVEVPKELQAVGEAMREMVKAVMTQLALQRMGRCDYGSFEWGELLSCPGTRGR
jgi:hypothetical protein